MGLLAVSARSPTLLGVVLEALRYRGMQDKANVFLVDAEAEGNGGYDDLYFVAHPPDLYLLPIAVGHARVIEVAGQAMKAELATELLALLAREAVDDSAHVVELGDYQREDVV